MSTLAKGGACYDSDGTISTVWVVELNAIVDGRRQANRSCVFDLQGATLHVYKLNVKVVGGPNQTEQQARSSKQLRYELILSALNSAPS